MYQKYRKWRKCHSNKSLIGIIKLKQNGDNKKIVNNGRKMVQMKNIFNKMVENVVKSEKCHSK